MISYATKSVTSSTDVDTITWIRLERAIDLPFSPKLSRLLNEVYMAMLNKGYWMQQITDKPIFKNVIQPTIFNRKLMDHRSLGRKHRKD